MYRALSDPTRLRIVSLLLEREMCVGDMVLILDVPQSTASRHLKYLKDAMLVQSRQTHYWVHYFLVSPETTFHARLLESARESISLIPESQQDALRAVEVMKDGGCCPND